MNDEEYLRACGGWTCDYGHTYRTLDKEVHDPWSHEHHGSGLTIVAAVEAQLAEDRARFAFVLHRTPPLVATERGETAAVAALGAIMEEHRPGANVPTITPPPEPSRRSRCNGRWSP